MNILLIRTECGDWVAEWSRGNAPSCSASYFDSPWEAVAALLKYLAEEKIDIPNQAGSQ